MLPLYGFRLGPASVLYPFRFVDPVTSKWTRGRYVAERREIEARYTEWGISGEPEVQRGASGAFSPWW